jgi:hypothetical protein
MVERRVAARLEVLYPLFEQTQMIMMSSVFCFLISRLQIPQTMVAFGSSF